MKIHHIGSVTYIAIEDHDLEMLKSGYACRIKERYYIFIKTPDIDLDDTKIILDSDKQVILAIYPEQIALLEDDNFISYTETLRLSLSRSFEEYIKNFNFEVINITCETNTTLQ